MKSFTILLSPPLCYISISGMREKVSKSLQVPTVTAPIHLALELPPTDTLNFLMAPVAPQLLLVNLAAEVPVSDHFLLPLPWVATHLHYDNISKYIFIGGQDGSIARGELHHTGRQITIDKIYKYGGQINRQPSLHVAAVMYVRVDTLVVWGLEGWLRVIDVEEMELRSEGGYSGQIACGLGVQYKDDTLGCVAFKDGYPPIVFDTEQQSQFEQIYGLLGKFYKENQLRSEQITQMLQYRSNLVCASTSQDQHFVTVYSLHHTWKESTQYYLEPIYTMQTNQEIIHLTLRERYLLATMYTQVLMYDLHNRKKCFESKSDDLQVTHGWVLSVEAGTTRLGFVRGWTHVAAGKQAKGVFKLRVRDKTMLSQGGAAREKAMPSEAEKMRGGNGE